MLCDVVGDYHRIVLTVSGYSLREGEIAAIMIVLHLPFSAVLSNLVSDEERHAIWFICDRKCLLSPRVIDS
jgi:hypothetical protein